MTLNYKFCRFCFKNEMIFSYKLVNSRINSQTNAQFHWFLNQHVSRCIVSRLRRISDITDSSK